MKFTISELSFVVLASVSGPGKFSRESLPLHPSF